MFYQRSVIFFFVVLFGLMNIKSFGQFASTDFLKASGPVIRNQSGEGEMVSLRGTNLGSWLSMEHWIGPLGYGVINRQNWEITGSISVSGNDFDLMLDGNEDTKWNSGTKQNSYSNQHIIIDCRENIVFDKICIKAGAEVDEAPAGFTLSISTDGTTWTEVSSGTGSQTIELETGAVETRYVKLAQTGSSDATWSIAEFYLLMNDDFSVRNATYDHFGVAKADTLWDYYQNLWITEADLDSIRLFGMNMVRVPFYWMEVMNNDGTMKENAFTQLDWIVEQCSEREIYVMLDLHGAPGGLDAYITSGQAVKNELWTSSEYQQMTIDLWKAVAEHFKSEPAVCAYDLMNEPVSSTLSFTISAMYNKIYKAVREIDPDHIISVQAFYNFDMINSPYLMGWENVLYQAHYYNTDYDNWDSQNGFINWALADLAWHQMHWKVPVLAGEYNFWNHLDLWSKWMNGINSFSGSWSNWCYKNNTGQKNWGLFLGNANPVPELSFDSEEEIKVKWDKFTTPNFRRNDELIDTISTHAKNTPYIGIGDQLFFEAYDGSYISSESGSEAMTCNKFSVGESEVFTIIDAGDGKIALLGNNGKYVSSNNGSGSMTCDKAEISESEKFYWIDLPDGEMALLGKGGFVSMEGGSTPITANRSSFDGWEIFSWGKKETATSVMDVERNFKIYPNPVGKDGILYYSLDYGNEIQCETYNSTGNKVFNTFLTGQGSINLSFLSSGIYFLKLDQKQEKLIIR